MVGCLQGEKELSMERNEGFCTHVTRCFYHLSSLTMSIQIYGRDDGLDGSRNGSLGGCVLDGRDNGLVGSLEGCIDLLLMQVSEPKPYTPPIHLRSVTKKFFVTRFGPREEKHFQNHKPFRNHLRFSLPNILFRYVCDKNTHNFYLE